MSTPTYDFDEAFQEKVAALLLRDVDFNARTDGLVEPGYFTNHSVAKLVDIHLNYWNKYKACPSPAAIVKLVSDGVANKTIRSEMLPEIKQTIATILKAPLSDKNFVIDTCAEFARHQAIMRAMEESIPALEKRDFGKIEKAMNSALRVGSLEEGEVVDVWQDIAARTAYRAGVLSGTVKKRSVTTGISKLDSCLMHGGWGIGELSSLMAPAKAGKSFGLMNFAVNASLAGHPTLHVSLENGNMITTDRIDAYVSGVKTMDIIKNHAQAETEILRVQPKAAPYKLHRFPAATFKPKDLRRLIESYRAKGLKFDLVVIDYADIMAPDTKTRDNPIEDSKNVYLGIRDIAVTEDLAMLTATQTNREGAKAATATATHVAEDYNRIRICDLVISINADEDEKSRNEKRLYFAAGRNQEDGYTITVKSDLATARFIERVLNVSRS